MMSHLSKVTLILVLLFSVFPAHGLESMEESNVVNPYNFQGSYQFESGECEIFEGLEVADGYVRIVEKQDRIEISSSDKLITLLVGRDEYGDASVGYTIITGAYNDDYSVFTQWKRIGHASGDEVYFSRLKKTETGVSIRTDSNWLDERLCQLKAL